jgi:hypothetical protein
VTSEETGETGESSFDDIPVSSVIYIGRGSFRMEAVAVEPDGVVQAVEPGVTAPLHARPREVAEGNTSARRPRSLFGSQIDVPLLAAPIGSAGFHAPGVTLTRGMLATLGGAVLLSGILVGTAARHLFASPPAPTPFAAAPVRTPTPPAPTLTAPAVMVPAPIAAAPASIAPAPVAAAIHARPRAVAKPTVASARKLEEPATATATAKPWVDPWAD